MQRHGVSTTRGIYIKKKERERNISTFKYREKSHLREGRLEAESLSKKKSDAFILLLDSILFFFLGGDRDVTNIKKKRAKL